ncbi:MAG: cation transporter [Planctomycetes bacterium]|nr:cation transporter [Planctomycetota bacterium]
MAAGPPPPPLPGEASRCAAVGMAGNISLMALKLVVGILAGSTALLADAVESMTDVVATFVAYLGVRIAERPADRDHHFGHGNAEAIAATAVAAIILMTGLGLCVSAVLFMVEGRYRAPDPLALVAAAVSMAVKEALYRYTIRVARRTRSPALLSVASDHRSDVLTSVAALVGVAGARLAWPLLDPLAACVIGLFVLRLGYGLMRSGLDRLMAGVPPGDLELDVTRTLHQTEGVLAVREVRLQGLGSYANVAVAIAVDGRLSVTEGHAIAHRAEERVRAQCPSVRFLEVHVEPHRPQPPTESP